MNLKIKPRFDNPALAQLLISLVLIPPLTGWIGDILKDWLSKDLDDKTLFVVALLIVALLATLAYKAGKKLTPPLILAEYQGEKVEHHPILISLLSLINPENLKYTGQHWQIVEHQLPETLDKVCEWKPENTDKPPSFPWQQNLRAARHHAKNGALKKLILIGSLSGKGGSGTPESLQLARQFFAYYLPDVEIQVPGLENPAVYSPDFEKLDTTRHALKKAIEYSGASDKDIIIDVTGGQKTASIAAMMVTLDRKDLMFQYVGTGSQTGRIFGFNVITETSQG